MSSSFRLLRLVAVLVTAILVVCAPAGATPGASAAGTAVPPGTAPHEATGPGLYIVTLVDRPSAAYAGDVPGLAATMPRPGQRFDRTRPAVAAYEQWLTDRQDIVLSRIDNPEVLYRFTTALSGFVAELSTAQVKRLRTLPGVALVERSSRHHLDSTDSPEHLGLERAWAAQGGRREAGRGMVVGVVDSGIWPENPSFAGLPRNPRALARELPGFHGACRPADQWDTRDCNDKIVSARYFVKGFGTQDIAQSDYLSPRDGSGHGSHTASTAAGNSGVAVRVEGQELGAASGMAPAARIAAYKACWVAPNPDDDGCATPDLVAAINQAVADGVDVISYSVSGPRHGVTDSVELAFLNAAAGGVFVAASAGNDGPGAGTVAHASPWVTTVGASTHRLLQGSLVLGDGTAYVGAMVSDRRLDAPLVLAADVAADHVTAAEAAICEVGSLAARSVQGKIVVCDRGVTARVDKSLAVARAGGLGMVLANTAPDSRDADFHAVPTVHLDLDAATSVKDYIARAEQPRATLDPDGADQTAIPQVAEFSGRGPVAPAAGDLLKPDLTAPGVSVVGAVAPPSNGERLWDLRSGTSMSTAHVAGLAAFLNGARPRWSPARVKSAMMTTASALTRGNQPLVHGAGQVDPTRFLDPGLVYESTADDWWSFLAGQGLTHADGSPVARKPLQDASELNLPSIAVGDLTGRTTVTRTVRNVTGQRAVFRSSVSAPDGVTVTVRPAVLRIPRGGTATFRVRFETQPGAPLSSFSAGALTWTSEETASASRIPLVVRAAQLAMPREVNGTGSSGSLTVEGRSGSTGSMELHVAGLAPAGPTPVSLVPGRFDPAHPTTDADTLRTSVTVNPGTDVARFELDGHNAGDDLDVFVYRRNGSGQRELVAVSATPGVDEQVTLVEPEAGSYELYVSSASAANGSTTSGQLYVWTVAAADSANLTLGRQALELGVAQPLGYTVSWGAAATPDAVGLDDTQRWLGSIRYGDTDRRTLITIN